MIRNPRRALPPLALAAVAGWLPAQAVDHGPFADARRKAADGNQRVLLMLTGGDADTTAAMTAAMADYRVLGKLLRYEYQVAALPAESPAAAAARDAAGLVELAPPALVILDADAHPLATLDGAALAADGGFSVDRVRTVLEEHTCEPLRARDVLAGQVAAARASGRHVFVYLSAPW